MTKEPKVFKMGVKVRFHVPIQTLSQQSRVGEVVAQAISQGRAFDVRPGDNRSVLVLVSAADDLGHVTKIDPDGSYKDIGVTEKSIGG